MAQICAKRCKSSVIKCAKRCKSLVIKRAKRCKLLFKNVQKGVNCIYNMLTIRFYF